MRRLVAAIAAVTILAPLQRALAFDTFWHSACSGGVAQHLGFSADATNLLQFGTFGPDFFGPAYDKVFEKIEGAAKVVGGQVRKSGVFMHFDNLHGDADRNWKYDYIFTRLAYNTANTIAAFYQDSSLNEGTRKILVLETLGCSLHMIQDFYSHSDWIHFDFAAIGFPPQKSEWGQDYAPSWFQVRALLGSPPTDGPETWPFEPHTGIYPPKATAPLGNFKVPLSHTNMNHDNSQLFYDGVSQIPYHDYGAHPAKVDPAGHQLFAVSTAAMASVEWISILEKENSAVKAAIDDAKGWDIKKYNPAMLTDLTNGLALALGASCAVNTWDGPKPPPARKSQCAGGRLGGAAMALFYLPNLNEFWVPYFSKNVLEKLTAQIGDPSTGRYVFDKAWLAARRVPPANTTAVHLANGLTLDAPTGATSSGTASSTSVTGTDLGTVQIDVASSSETAAQAASQAQQPGQPPPTPDPPVIDPPDWMIGGGGGIRSQRTIGGTIYRCTATGLSAAQTMRARLACRSLRKGN